MTQEDFASSSTQAALSDFLSDPDNVQDSIDALLQEGEEARDDIIHFFELVMREETTRVPIAVAAHQKVVLEFAMAHKRSVIMLPVGHSKTFSLAGLSLWLLGRNPTLRGAIVSATQGQAEKPLSMVRDYIEMSPALKLVFPELARSERYGDSWTQTKLTVQRPPGIRDASLVAVGYKGKIDGSRLSWILVDDILTLENTSTREARDGVYDWFDASVLARLDPKGARICVTNTAWHPDDLVHRLDKQGWPTLRMGISGEITIHNTEWDSADLRPSTPRSFNCRLSAHDPDPTNSTPLWPEKYTPEVITELRTTHLPRRFNQLFEQVCRDDSSSPVKQEWIDKCIDRGKGLTLVSRHETKNLVVTGVDLAIGEGEEHDDTAFFTFECLEDGSRLILDIEAGKFDAPTIVAKVIAKQKAYNSIIRVENNATQGYIRQFALRQNVSLPIKPHTTGRAKAHPELGVQGLFIELFNGAWIIPSDRSGFVVPIIQRWIDACLYYSASKHTDDVLMACVTPGAMVTTRRGPVPIEDVWVGDFVLTHRGRWREVTETMKRRHRGVVHEVKPCGGLSFFLTPEHPVWRTGARIETETRKNRLVPRSDEWGFEPVEGLRLGSMAKGDFLLMPVPEVEATEAPAWKGVVVDDELAALMGLYLAEGSCGGEAHQVSIYLHEDETALVDYVRGHMARVFGANSRRYGRRDNAVVAVTAWSKHGYAFFHPFASRGEKCVPWELWNALPQRLRMHVVRGWMLGDGCYNVQKDCGRISGVSISRALLAQMREALHADGYLVTLGTFQKECFAARFSEKLSHLHDSWRLAFNQRDTRRFLETGSNLERAAWGVRGTGEKRSGVTDRTNTRLVLGSEHGQPGILTRLTSNETQPYNGLVFNLHVDEDESYCVEGVAVHNCYFAREMARHMGRGSKVEQKRQGSLGASIMAR